MDEEKIYKIGSYDIYLDIRIGAGNYSCVYIGTCNDINICQKYNLVNKTFLGKKIIKNVVAIKKICISGLSYKQKKIVAQELEVINFLKQCVHDNIVACYEIINDIDTVYAVMEYCDDGNLARYIKNNDFDEQTIKNYFGQIINGVTYLHDNKIIHRDIKPDNILLSNGCIKICDFGLSKIFSGLKKVNSVCGSPLYMAPELFRDKCYNYAIDIWSCGVLLYELLYKKNPLVKIKDYKELEQFMISTEDIIIPPNNTKYNVSDDCIELLKIILCKETDKRITLSDIGSHKWLTNNNDIYKVRSVSSFGSFDAEDLYGNNDNIFIMD